MSSAVLDASALLAFLHDEPGAAEVEKVLQGGACMSALNWAEVLSKLADYGQDPALESHRLSQLGLVGGEIEIVPLEAPDAVLIAKLRSPTRSAGLSLGDRACLALGQRRGLPVVTADRAWTSLSLPVTVHLVR